MTRRSPAGPLMKEHRIIERFIAVLEREIESIAEEGRTDPRTIDVAVDFIRNYADSCHHGKEEYILFDRLAAKHLEPDLYAEMQELIQDHVYGRKLTRALVDANSRYASGDAAALPEIASTIQALVRFYPVHIEKEDRHFFKPCLEYFDEDERATMVADFDEFDRSLVHERYREVVESLEAR